MNEQGVHSAAGEQSPDRHEIYDEDGVIRADYVARIGAAIADRDTLYLKEHVASLHESELGDLIESLQPNSGMSSFGCSAKISTMPR